MKRRLSRRGVRIAIVAVATCCVIYVLSQALFRPREANGPQPTTLYASVPLDGATNIKKLKWSPSGRYVLIEAVTIRTYSSDPKDGLLVVVSAADRTVAYRKSGVRHAFWGKDDSLWIWNANDWLVHSPPFTSCAEVKSGYGRKSERPFDHHPWDFAPNSKRLAVATHAVGTDDWRVHIYEDGHESFALTLTPKNPNGDQRTPNLKFSPSGSLLAVVFTGWIGHEQSGPEEFWLLDVDRQSASHLHSGKIRWTQLVDCDAQCLDPSWSSSEDAVVFGDSHFGIGELSIPAGWRSTILGKRSDTYDVLLSPSGRWISFHRWPGEDDDPGRYDRCMGVISRDGRRVLHMPPKYVHWPYIYLDWHPSKDAIAVLYENPGNSSLDLLYWNLEEGDSVRSEP